MMTVAGKEVVHTREVTCGEAEDHPLVYYVIGKKRRKKSKKNFLL
jgi:hypothetical protein